MKAMAPKTPAQIKTVRDTESRKRARGLHEYRIWARGKDGKRNPEIGKKLNAYAEEISRVEKEEE